MKKIIIINGPNINLIGTRESEIYGKIKIKKYLNKLKKKYYKKNLLIKIYYINCEGLIIKFLQNIKKQKENIIGVIINAGAYSHTSLAISDTIKYLITNNINIIEVHLSNIYQRENIRHLSLLSKNCTGIIVGLGIIVYEVAIISLIKKICIL
ncbi:MAG: type II 3-dehydroquinate dehydratase [Candidatus Shikimatogenerans bostrichidophilus]|nr:MAG: type II 3-dehydroquinate dehydratase [Candidatus Shikimatogenerans bostrichidophilus]